MDMKTLAAAFVAAMALTNGASTASAQTTCPSHAHLSTTVTSCGAGGATYDCGCVCNAGYHQDGLLENGEINCVRYPDVCDPELLGTESNGRGGCRCTAENRAAGAIGTLTVRFSPADRRELGLPGSGNAIGCYHRVDGEMIPGPQGDWRLWATSVDEYLAYLDAGLRASCGASAEATRPEVIEMCRQAQERLGGINPADPNIDRRLAEIDTQLVSIEDALNQLRDDLAANTAHDAEQDTRIGAIESTLHGFARSVHIRLGGFGRLGGMLHGPMTGAGGASVELLFRFGDLPVGLYGRFLFGGQSTGWDVGDSMYVGGGAGLTAFTGGRDDTTFSLGWHADTLLDPYARDHGFDHDSLGVYNGALLSMSIPIPGAPAVRIYLGLDAGLAERRMIDSQAVYHVIQDVAVSGMVGLEVQIPSFM